MYLHSLSSSNLTFAKLLLTTNVFQHLNLQQLVLKFVKIDNGLLAWLLLGLLLFTKNVLLTKHIINNSNCYNNLHVYVLFLGKQRQVHTFTPVGTTRDWSRGS